MTRILAGVLAAVAVLAGILWWRLDVVAAQRDAASLRAATASQALEEQKTQATLLLKRFDALDAALGAIRDGTDVNNQQLTKTLTGIDQIKRTANDTLESISCLDVRVPGDLDRLLRNPAPAGKSH